MPWFVIYTQARNEKKVALRLENIGIEVYCPLVTQIRQWSDRKKKVETPLISSYVFVNVTENEREKVFQVPGVVRYLFWLGKPAVIRNEEIEALKDSLKEAVFKTEITSLKPGSPISIPHGPFQGKLGTVSQVNKNSVKIILQEMGILITLIKHESA
ncbi:UpxY family transcription antiterminator [Flavobacterium pallidum]|uniref:Antitermination protein NusG n=1 Tax=Flavobacterium pallidum TaxID=2172098 RepID=A0A2S1SDJ0_9FLAO|nr:UpxY family transcription antiterminator [Flavobacterium pallidum]AWI24466.1 antitermination protein NusG [Flavobacterium pallidum]